MQPQSHNFLQPPSIKRSADEARRRIESELAGLAAIERELDRLDRQLSALRSQLVEGRPLLD